MSSNFQKILKNRLKQRTNKNFVKWMFDHKIIKENELHHLLGSFIGGQKQNDYYLVEIPKQMHKDIHYQGPLREDEFIEMFILSQEKIFDYIEMLEQRIELLKSLIPKKYIEMET